MTILQDKPSTSEVKVKPRAAGNWIDSFCTFGSTFNTTPAYLEAAAIWCIGTAAGRAIASRVRGNQLHPNLFMQMVGGPGTGKSQAVSAVRQVFVPATGYSVIPASITRAGLEDYMAENLQQRKSPDGSLLLSHECIGLSEEMQGILPDQDLGHLTLYNILYDLPKKHVARTRSHGEISLESPYCSILTGAQPAFLATAMPEQAWGMGFMSRSILVFDVPRERRSMFELSEVDRTLQSKLITDLREIFSLFGWFRWTPQAVALYDNWWVKHGGPPVPKAKRLAMGYNARRELHFAKLAMIQSLARSSDLEVTLDDVQRAIEYLLRTEDRMQHIFTEMAQTGTMVAIQDLLDVVRARSAAGESIAEADLINILMQRFPPNQVHAIVDNLVSAGALKVTGGIDARGFRKFGAGDRIATM